MSPCAPTSDASTLFRRRFLTSTRKAASATTARARPTKPARIPEILDGGAVGADGAVAAEPIGTETDGDTKHEEVTEGEQTAQAQERNCGELARSRWSHRHTKVLGFSHMTLKLREGDGIRRARLSRPSHFGHTVRL